MPTSAPTYTASVSIVIPCYVSTQAQAELLKETLRTVSAQVHADHEVILVDDGSPVPVAAVVGVHPQIAVIRQENAGPAIARNSGIAQSRGQYIVFLDADDHLLTGALSTGITALENNPGAGIAVGPREEMTCEGEPVSWHVPPPPSETRIYLPLLGFDWYIIPPSAVMFRREVVVSVGGLSGSLGG